jgi:tetratricopeptide (TPR) repeat protein
MSKLSGLLVIGLAIAVASCPRAALAQANAKADAKAVAQAQECFERGEAAYAKGQLKQALAEFLRAYALAPSMELEFDLGRVYERIGEPDAAIRHFQAYADGSQLDQAARAQIEARIGKLVELRTRQRAPLIEAPPAAAELTAEARAFFERGAKLFRLGQFEAALVAFASARRFAQLPELAYNLAVTSERLSRWNDAVDYYRTYLREAKNAPDAELIKARIRAISSTDRSPRRRDP